MTKNTDSLRKILRSINLGLGSFELVIANCNSLRLRSQLIEQLHKKSKIPLEQHNLTNETTQLYSDIVKFVQQKSPQALIVCGFEKVDDLERLWTSANLIREEFRKNCPIPMIWWLRDKEFLQFLKFAPDFYSSVTVDEFIVPVDYLQRTIKEITDHYFEQLIKLGATWQGLIWKPTHKDSLSFQDAWQALQYQKVQIEPNLEASVLFLLGRLAKETEQFHFYQKSLAVWQQEKKLSNESILRKGIVLFFLGYWLLSEQKQINSDSDLLHKKNTWIYIKEALDCWERLDREDVVAKFINVAGESLIKLEKWKDLEKLIKKTAKLRSLFFNPVWDAHYLGILKSELAKNKQHWQEVENLTKEALDILERVEINQEIGLYEETLKWARGYHKIWFLLLLAQSKNALNEFNSSISYLEKARSQQDKYTYYSISLYLRILEELHNVYYKAKNYVEAFKIREQQQMLEYQYGYRAFVGVGRLQPKIHQNGIITIDQQQDSLGVEITASKRRDDLNELIKQIKNNQCKLIILYGESGVGKSSLIDAGLIPSLEGIYIDNKKVKPILLRCYDTLEKDIKKILDSLLVESSKQIEKKNCLTVLILDQFEECFVVNKKKSINDFFLCLEKCLDISFIKIIFSLRSDCLHQILEYSNISNNYLIRNVFAPQNIQYKLTRLSTNDARKIITNLTHKTYLNLNPKLIELLLQELSGGQESDSEELLPIELQIVGAQLQNDKITTVDEYKSIKINPKNQRVETKNKVEIIVYNYISGVLEECGPENEKIAGFLIYYLAREHILLTKYQLLKEIKTSPIFIQNSPVKTYEQELEKVLSILLASGLIILNGDKYQLVHDYLAKPIRELQEPKIEEFREKLQKEIQKEITTLKQATEKKEKLQEDIKSLEVRRGKAHKFFRGFTQALIQWMPLGGSGWIFVSFLRQGEWLLAVLMFPVMAVTVVWAAYTEAILTRLREISQERGKKDVDSFIERLEEINQAIRWQLAGTEDKYLRCQGGACRDYSTEGYNRGTFVPLLSEVFVPLELDSNFVKTATGEQLPMYPGFRQEDKELIEALAQNRLRIWELLARVKQYPAFSSMTILAWGGYGKTTLLRHITYTYAKHHYRRYRVPQFLPVLLLLRKWQETIATEQNLDLPNLIEKHHIPSLPEGTDLKLPPQWAKNQLRKGKMLVMCDGFDEVKPEWRESVSRWLNKQMQDYQKSVFILTSRPAGYKDYAADNSLSSKLYVKPFNADQRERFVQQWYMTQESYARPNRKTAEVKPIANSNTANLLQQLQELPTLNDLARNPLLLNMIANLHRSYGGQKLLQRRCELYQDILTLQLKDRPRFRSIDMLVPFPESQQILQKVALELVKQNKPSIKRQDLENWIYNYLQELDFDNTVKTSEFLNQIVDVSELIVKRDEDLEFAHLSFQGYLAAAEIKAQNEHQLLRKHWRESWWKETILLYCGLPLVNPSNLIGYLSNIKAIEAISLAHECLKESPGKIDSKVEAELKQLEQSVNKSFYEQLENYLQERQWEAANRETYYLMLQIVGKEEGQSLDTEDLRNFPCEDLRTINQLWVSCSDGKFGFSVQKEIYESLGGTQEYNEEVWQTFCEHIGWERKEDSVNKAMDLLTFKSILTFNDNAHNGHLPIPFKENSVLGGLGGLGIFYLPILTWRFNLNFFLWYSIAQRLATCNV